MHQPQNSYQEEEEEEEAAEEDESLRLAVCLQCVSGERSIHRGEAFRAATCCSSGWVRIGREPAADLVLTPEALKRCAQSKTTPPPPHDEPLRFVCFSR